MYDFHFSPKSEQELTDLLEEGPGTYEVTKAEPKEKDNCLMLVLTLNVWDKNGQQTYITDFLKFDTTSNFCMRKIRHFCYSTNMQKEWEAGHFSAADCVGRGGKLMIGTQKEKKTDDGKVYPPKSIVRDYIIDDSDLKGAVNQLQQRRNAVNQNRDDLPPVDAYGDIPL